MDTTMSAQKPRTRKERPILMNTEMVKAILEGRKTQTRRPIKNSQAMADPQCKWYLPHPGGGWWGHDADTPDAIKPCGERGFPCPYGEVGDRLWVRETWKLRYFGDLVNKNGCVCQINYSTGIPEEVCVYGDDCYSPAFNKQDLWRPSIFMPRWASRLTLEIVNIKIQRVQDVNQEDTKAEGVKGIFDDWAGPGNLDYRKPFKELWNNIYSAKGFSWYLNPWVWVVEFKVVEA